jgi:hypothetical protein
LTKQHFASSFEYETGKMRKWVRMIKNVGIKKGETTLHSVNISQKLEKDKHLFENELKLSMWGFREIANLCVDALFLEEFQ